MKLPRIWTSLLSTCGAVASLGMADLAAQERQAFPSQVPVVTAADGLVLPGGLSDREIQFTSTPPATLMTSAWNGGSDGDCVASVLDCDGCGTTCHDEPGLLSRLLDKGPCGGCLEMPFVIGNSLGVPRGIYAGGLSQYWVPTHLTAVADNNGVLPTNRIGTTFQWMDNVPLEVDPGSGQSIRDTSIYVYRLTAERTILGGAGSILVHVPFNYTVSSSLGLSPNLTHEFGDIAFGPKLLLLERGGWSFSGGVLFEAPTSPEVTFSPGPGKTAPLLTNSQWFITPYLGVARRQGRSFSQTFISYRDQTNGEVVTQDPLTRLPTQDLVMLSSQVGFWLRRDASRTISGIAPVAELHYSTTPENDRRGTYTDEAYGRVDQLTLTAGLNLEINQNALLSIGYGLPLRDNPHAGGLSTDRMYDGELTVNFNVLR
ncbi:MAG: hypothetical protein KDA83_06265 [Planctomycetales bacterium]|nr:hypothetical protein [Planctomycetales bacterium]